MILVDTSVWIDHFRHGDSGLVKALDDDAVLVHPFVIGELACGNLRNRTEILHLLDQLPASPLASHSETMAFIERRQLMGRGIGYVDAHLLAAAMISGDAQLWTKDKRLASVASDLRTAYLTTEL